LTERGRCTYERFTFHTYACITHTRVRTQVCTCTTCTDITTHTNVLIMCKRMNNVCACTRAHTHTHTHKHIHTHTLTHARTHTMTCALLHNTTRAERDYSSEEQEQQNLLTKDAGPAVTASVLAVSEHDGSEKSKGSAVSNSSPPRSTLERYLLQVLFIECLLKRCLGCMWYC
jgi:hypothetical protein